MKLITRNPIAAIFIGVILCSLAFFSAMNVLPTFAGILVDRPTVTPTTYQTYDFFAASSTPTVSATSTSATSTNILSWTDPEGRRNNGALVIAGAKKVTLYFSRGDTTGQGNLGTSEFRIQTTLNADTLASGLWTDYGELVQSTSTAITLAALVPTASSSAATTTLRFGMNLNYSAFYAIRCIVKETVDGEHSCKAYVEY